MPNEHTKKDKKESKEKKQQSVISQRRRSVLRATAGAGALGFGGFAAPGVAISSEGYDGPTATRNRSSDESLDWVDADKIARRAAQEIRSDGPVYDSLDEPRWISSNDEAPWWTGVESDSDDVRLLVKPKELEQSDVGTDQICFDQLSFELGKKEVGVEICAGSDCEDIEASVGLGVWSGSIGLGDSCGVVYGGCADPPLVGSLCVNNIKMDSFAYPSTIIYVVQGEVELCLGTGPFKKCWDASFYQTGVS